MKPSTTKTIQLILSLLLGDRNPSVAPYAPSKTKLLHKTTPYFKRSTPAALGVSPERIIGFLTELESDKSLMVHSVMVLKDGKVISEAYAPGFSGGVAHLSHSMSKTVTAIATAALLDEKKLDTGMCLSEIFTELSLPKYAGEITVGDLVKMSSGLSFSEFATVTTAEWTDALLNSDAKFPHGEGFHYNSMNSYLLARIIERLSGESFGDFVRTRLFEPLRIENYLWERGPEGTEKGGWGLYLAPEDWLKIATLFITDGKFDGKTVVSGASMHEILLSRNEFSRENNENFDYAGHVNMHKFSSAVLLNGLFGQDVYVDPANALAIVVMSGSPELFKRGGTVNTILKYFPPELDDKRLGRIANWKKQRALDVCQKQFFSSRAFISEIRKKRSILNPFSTKLKRTDKEKSLSWDAIVGSYTLPKNNAALLPLIQRAMNNNLSSGIDSVQILRDADELCFRFLKGDTAHIIRAGIRRYVEGTINVNGEDYIVRSIADTQEKDDGTVYKLCIIFPELPNTRYITLKKYTEDVAEIIFDETPSVDAFLPFLDEALEKSSFAAIAVGMIEKRLGQGFIKKKFRDLFSPSFIAPKTGSECEETVLREENAKIDTEREEIRSLPFISSFIKNKETEEKAKSTPKPKVSGILSFLSGLFGANRTEEEDTNELLLGNPE